MKKRIRTNRMHRYILASGLIMVSFGIWISCSKDSGISSLEPGPKSTKPAVTDLTDVDFHPQSGVNYDPFDGMTIAEREAAIGDAVVAQKYLEVMTYHLAHAMADDGARKILYENVPKPGEGTIHISELIMKYPYLLEVISGNFKRSVSDKAVVGGLSHVIQDIESDGKAILSASKALFDLEIRLVTPETGGWLPAEKIPVFYTPIDVGENRKR